MVPIKISIHALRVEGDAGDVISRVALVLISIHALRVEGDASSISVATRKILFLSTPSGWRATSGSC